MNRRQFLRLSLSAAPALRRGSQGTAARSDAPIVVVGAGLAGMRAAEVIRDAGRSVIVLEAAARPGGRVLTIRRPFDEDLHAEAGPLRIAGAHRAVIRAVRAHRLTLVPFESAQGRETSALNGRRGAASDPASAWMLDLKPGEAALSQRGLLERYVGSLPSELADPLIPLASYSRWQEYDRVSWPSWLLSRGASPDAVKLMTLGSDSSNVSALYVLRQYAMLGTSTQRYKIDGGMDRLSNAMATALGNVVVYNAAVVRVTRDGGGFRVDYDKDGRTQNLVARRVVFAVPLTTLRRIEIRPRLSAPKALAIEQLAYYSGVRVLLQSKTRFWNQVGLNGSARTDRATEVWDATHDQLRQIRGILGASIGGAPAVEANRLSPDQSLSLGRDLVADGFPQIREQFEKGVVHRWDLEPWTRGAFVAGRPGQMSALLPHIAGAENGMHFAGEHTSAWMGWMEGALESGERVARELLDAP